jgi:hypothetical protein
MAAVREIPDRKAAEATGRPAALVETIFGRLAEAAPPGELTVRLDLESVGDLKAQPTGPALAVELVRGWDRATVLGREMEAGRDLGRAVAPEQAWERDRVVGTGQELGQEAEAERD